MVSGRTVTNQWRKEILAVAERLGSKNSTVPYITKKPNNGESFAKSNPDDFDQPRCCDY
jgi:hypothetical protein